MESPTFQILVVSKNTSFHRSLIKAFSNKNSKPVRTDNNNEVIIRNKKDYIKIICVYQNSKIFNYFTEHNRVGLICIDGNSTSPQTIKKINKLDNNVQILLCTDTLTNTSKQIKNLQNLFIVKKPFTTFEIKQATFTMLTNIKVKQKLKSQIHKLQKTVTETSKELENSYSLIQATLDSTHEGILAISYSGEIITFNNMFVTLWDIPTKILRQKKANSIFKYLSNQAEESKLFYEILTDIYKYPKDENIREWKQKSGNVIEVYIHPQYINKKVIGFVLSFRDVTERKNMEALLLHQATHDLLTGLPNRVLLADRLQQAILNAKRRGLLVGVLLFDLDNFKHINDTLGHTTGDSLLKMVGNRLKACIRESDTVTRLGGDEFVVVLSPVAKEENLVAKANDLLKKFLTPFEVSDRKITITTSVGVSIFPNDGQEPDTLLMNADAALYRAKDVGRNNVQFYLAEFNENVIQKAELTNDLRQAISGNQLVLHYQPLINLSTGQITGLEALIRWNHPVLGRIPPNTFIPLAEESGLIVSIGEWILREACAQNKKWQSLIPGLCVAVNISANQFNQVNFVEMIRNILNDTELKPYLLELEITEGLLIGNTSSVSRQMIDLKLLGVRLAMDDFGTGYASLSYLKYFPFDKVKIDKCFVAGIGTSNEDRSIIEAIINMARAMGLEVLAEGVEKQEQIEFLKERHSNLVQGFYFSPALDAVSCEKLLLKQKVGEPVF